MSEYLRTGNEKQISMSYKASFCAHQSAAYSIAFCAINTRATARFPFTSGLDAMQLHQLSDALFTHAHTACHQLFPHFWPAVFLFDLSVDGQEVHQQGFVADALLYTRFAGRADIFATPVFKVATGADLQYLATQCDRPVGLVSCNPGVLHRDSRAKYAVAFFKMSRSILTLDSSARSRASSICSGLTGLSPAPLS